MADNPTNKKKKGINPTLEDAYSMARDMMNRSTKDMGAIESEDRRFRDMFGVGGIVALCAYAWLEHTGLLPEGGTFVHFLWTLCFLKVYPTETPLSALCGGADPKTIRKYIWPFIFALANLEIYLILWEDRLEGDIGNDCTISADGTDFRVPERGRLWYSHKFKKSGVRYEIGLCILTGKIVWIQGPFNCGEWPDVSIFRDSLLSHLADAGECAELDDGYLGVCPEYGKCPKSFTTEEETAAMTARVRMRQETVNKRFKQFGILKQVYRHDIANHGEVFRAVAGLTQLALIDGEPLFSVGYRDPPFDNPYEVDDDEPEWDGINETEEVAAAIARNGGFVSESHAPAGSKRNAHWKTQQYAIHFMLTRGSQQLN